MTKSENSLFSLSRDIKLFLLVPALIAAAISLSFQIWPPNFPHPSQAQALAPFTIIPILALGCLGIAVWTRLGFSSIPTTRSDWQRLTLNAGLHGVIFGLLALGFELWIGFAHLLAQKLGISSIHMAFPASLLNYTAGAIIVECLYRLIPIPLILGILFFLKVRGHYLVIAFWVLAVITSCFEPLSQATLLSDKPIPFLALFGFIFIFNFYEAVLLKKYSWPAPLIARLLFYLLWHVIGGPYLA